MDPRTRPDHSPEQEERARSILLGNHPRMRFGRRVLARLPSDPRCKLCANPFGGVGGGVMRRFGRTAWPQNPKFCRTCFRTISTQGVGAEIRCSLLFADVRGSTSLAEEMRPSEFRSVMARFFQVATRILVRADAIVDKFVGDEVVAIFIPAMAGERHAAHAVTAARELVAATAPWIPVGAGVNDDTAYVGVVGEGDETDITAMGDAVNVTARLASMAAAREVLVTTSAAEAAGLDGADLDRRTLELRGRSRPVDVFVYAFDPSGAPVKRAAA